MINDRFYTLKDITSLIGIQIPILLKAIESKKINFNENGEISRTQLVIYIENELKKQEVIKRKR